MRKSKISEAGVYVRRSRGGWQVWRECRLPPSLDGVMCKLKIGYGLTRSEAHAMADCETILDAMDMFELF